MNVFINPYHPSHAIDRITVALKKYAPSEITFVPYERDSDLVVIYVTGRHDHVGMRKDAILTSGRKYAIVQLALASTHHPNPRDWVEIWNGAKVTWTYYNISKYCPSFYRAPLSSEPQSFYPVMLDKEYLVSTVGNYYGAECLWDVWGAARYLQKKIAHIGKPVVDYPWIEFYNNIPDSQLNSIYNRSSFVSALRTKEGFEIPAVEALFCRVRPILFDTPNYRQWYDGLARFIPEDDNIFDNLTHILGDEQGDISVQVWLDAMQRFDWTRIVTGFFERICE